MTPTRHKRNALVQRQLDEGASEIHKAAGLTSEPSAFGGGAP